MITFRVVLLHSHAVVVVQQGLWLLVCDAASGFNKALHWNVWLQLTKLSLLIVETHYLQRIGQQFSSTVVPTPQLFHSLQMFVQCC